jgi:hypothetical protein
MLTPNLKLQENCCPKSESDGLGYISDTAMEDGSETSKLRLAGYQRMVVCPEAVEPILFI